METVGGGRGGRGGRGRKKGGKKGLRQTKAITLGVGAKGVRWPGLSYPMEKDEDSKHWLQPEKLGLQRVDEEEEEGAEWKKDLHNRIGARDLEGEQRMELPESRKGWSFKGWSGRQWGGRYVGCPEAPDGKPLTDYRSVVIELKRVVNQTRGGKKRTVSALVVVGNGNGAAGFAVGKAEESIPAIRKAKNRAVNYLHFIPRCDSHTIYHNVKSKFCRTNILMERRVPGSGLTCQRAVTAICQLAGLKDMKAKIIGSTNPLNVVRATFKGLTSQESHQELADRTGLFLVEYRRECHNRPVVVAVPKSKSNDRKTTELLHELQLLPKVESSEHKSLPE